MIVQDWRGEYLIRSPRREAVETPRKRTMAEMMLDRRARIALAAKNADIVARLKSHAADGMTQSQAAFAEDVSKAWVSELTRFHGIAFQRGKPGPALGYRRDK